jgi:YHS domain-containing protein
MNKHTVRFLGFSLFILLCAVIAKAQIDKYGVEIAIKGYDPVSYFVNGKAREGSSLHTYEYRYYRWYFDTDKHLNMFKESPGRYIPKYFGFAADAVTRGFRRQADPRVWTMIDGDVYLFSNKQERDKWMRNFKDNIIKADGQWKEID